MVSAGDFRNGLTIEIDGTVYQVIEFQHVKPGKGAAFVRTKLKNVVDGGVVEKTFRPTEKFENAHIERKEMQYLYQDGDLYNFMDVETYDQIALNHPVRKITVGNTLNKTLTYQENDTIIDIKGERGLNLIFDKRKGGLSSFRYEGFDYLKSSLVPDFWRVNTDNDDWDSENNVWKNAISKMQVLQVTVEPATAVSKKEKKYEQIKVHVKTQFTVSEKPQHTIFFDTDYTVHADGSIRPCVNHIGAD